MGTLNKYIIPAVKRSFEVLEYLAENNNICHVTDISKHLEIPANSVYRIVSTLESLGYIERIQGGRIVLGKKIFALGNTVAEHLGINRIALPHMINLTELTKETSLLGVLVEDKVLIMEQIESPHPLKITVKVGSLFPSYISVFGKILLAHLPEDKMGEIISSMKMTRLTSQTITDPQKLKSHLKEIRSNGLGIDWQEYEDGIACVGVPILDKKGEVIASVGIHGPTSRLSRQNIEKLLPEIKEAGRKISLDMGCPKMLLG